MKIDLSTARELGELDARGNQLGDELAKLSASYVERFRAACEAHGLDPNKTAIDFDTGEATPADEKAVS